MDLKMDQAHMERFRWKMIDYILYTYRGVSLTFKKKLDIKTLFKHSVYLIHTYVPFRKYHEIILSDNLEFLLVYFCKDKGYGKTHSWKCSNFVNLFMSEPWFNNQAKIDRFIAVLNLKKNLLKKKISKLISQNYFF